MSQTEARKRAHWKFFTERSFIASGNGPGVTLPNNCASLSVQGRRSSDSRRSIVLGPQPTLPRVRKRILEVTPYVRFCCWFPFLHQEICYLAIQYISKSRSLAQNLGTECGGQKSTSWIYYILKILNTRSPVKLELE